MKDQVLVPPCRKLLYRLLFHWKWKQTIKTSRRKLHKNITLAWVTTIKSLKKTWIYGIIVLLNIHDHTMNYCLSCIIVVLDFLWYETLSIENHYSLQQFTRYCGYKLLRILKRKSFQTFPVVLSVVVNLASLCSNFCTNIVQLFFRLSKNPLTILWKSIQKLI